MYSDRRQINACTRKVLKVINNFAILIVVVISLVNVSELIKFKFVQLLSYNYASTNLFLNIGQKRLRLTYSEQVGSKFKQGIRLVCLEIFLIFLLSMYPLHTKANTLVYSTILPHPSYCSILLMSLILILKSSPCLLFQSDLNKSLFPWLPMLQSCVC